MHLKIRDKLLQIIKNSYTFFYALISPYLIIFLPHLALTFLRASPHKKQNFVVNSLINPLMNYNSSKLSKNIFGEEVNIVLRGKSLKDSKTSINKELPTFFINPKSEIDFLEFKFPILATSDPSIARNFLGFGKRRSNYPYYKKPPSEDVPVLYVNQDLDYFRKNKNDMRKLLSKEFVLKDLDFDNSIQISRDIFYGFVSHDSQGVLGDSGTNIIIYLAKNFKNINIFGWDYYRNNHFNPKLHVIFQIYLIWILGLRSGRACIRSYFATSIYSLIIANGLKNKNPNNVNVKINGFLSTLNNNRKFIDNLLPVFFKVK